MLANSAINPAHGPIRSGPTLLRTRRWRRRLARALTAAIVLLATAIALELWLEVREARRITAGDTFVELGNTRIRYRLTGSGEPVVFLSGMAATLEQFDRAQIEASTFATTLTYDRGGSGFSRGSAYDAEQQADELAALLGALGIRRPVVLVAFSSAASLGRVYVGRYRQRVSALILLDPYLPELEERTTSPWRARSYARWLMSESVRSLFGIKRASAWMESFSDRDVSLPHQKALATQRRFRHWWAVTRDCLATARTNRQVAAAGGLSDLHLIVLAGDMTPLGDLGRIQDEVVHDFARRSNYGSIRRLSAGDHGEMVWSEPNFVAVMRAVRDMVEH